MMRRPTIGFRALAALVIVSLSGSLAACVQDDLANQYREGSNKGYIAASGFETREYATAERGEPVVFDGRLDDGGRASNADYSGRVVVVNFWYASCGPCIAEAPALEEAHQALAPEDVSFVGLNIYDQAATALSFARDHGVTYPSMLGANDANLKLSFAEHSPLSAVPTTLVLDTSGRVAARLIGSLSDAGILEAIVQDVLTEKLNESE